MLIGLIFLFLRWMEEEEEDGKLDCMCAVGDVIDRNIVGPDVFCDSECKVRELAGSP